MMLRNTIIVTIVNIWVSMCGHVVVVFITGHEEDWGKGKRKRKRKGARGTKRSKHFLISPLPSTLLSHFYSTLSRVRVSLASSIGYMNLRLSANFPNTVFFLICAEEISLVFLNLHSYGHFPPCCSRYCARTSDGTKIERKKKGRGARKKEKKKTIATHTFNKIFTTAQSKSSSW